MKSLLQLFQIYLNIQLFTNKLYNNYGKLLYLIVRYYRKLNFTKHALVFEACA